MYDCIYGAPVDALGNPATASSTSFAFSTSTCSLASTTISTSTDIIVTPGMSAGEILISTMLFFILMVIVVRSVIGALSPIQAWVPRREKNK